MVRRFIKEREWIWIDYPRKYIGIWLGFINMFYIAALRIYGDISFTIFVTLYIILILNCILIAWNKIPILRTYWIEKKKERRK